jgi:hypothetical protein
MTVMFLMLGSFGAGWIVGWIQAMEPLKAKVRVLETTVKQLQSKSLGKELTRQQMERHQWKAWGQG